MCRSTCIDGLFRLPPIRLTRLPIKKASTMTVKLTILPAVDTMTLHSSQAQVSPSATVLEPSFLTVPPTPRPTKVQLPILQKHALCRLKASIFISASTSPSQYPSFFSRPLIIRIGSYFTTKGTYERAGFRLPVTDWRSCLFDGCGRDGSATYYGF
jgi:hypothetical protein